MKREFAEKLFVKMQEYSTSTLDTNELETLAQVLSSEIVIKAFGQQFMYCSIRQNEITALDMSEPANITVYTRGQGEINGIGQMIMRMLDLVIVEDEIEDE